MPDGPAFKSLRNHGQGMLASVCFTIFSTLFNLHAMREGVLLAGEGSGSLLADLRSIPRVILSLVLPNRERRD